MKSQFSSWKAAVPGRVAITVGALVVGALLAPSGAAAAGPVTTIMNGEAANAFTVRLGAARAAGASLDGAGRAVVAVTDADAAQSVRAAGGIARLVKHSTAELQSITAEFDRSARLPGTSWGVDPSTNQV